MKYIAFEGRLHQEIIIFAQSRDHAQMALDLNIERENILGAGFIAIPAATDPYCYGQSTSLNIASRGDDDTRLLHRLMERQ